MISTQPKSPIALLEPGVVAVIAAGEVVERPASVVKELVENALDAGASRIDVEVQKGGQSLIRVADDGQGMTPEQARLSVRRYATSKLRTVEDLNVLQSMGFRGEGLACVAAVARLELRTRTASAAEGTEVRVVAGQIEAVAPVGCRSGTAVTVRDLFFNAPVRRKFLKSVPTEFACVNDVVTRIASAFFDVRFTLRHDHRLLLDLGACSSRVERARHLFEKRGLDLCCASYRSDGVEVSVSIADPHLSTGASRALTLLLNRRSVRDRMLLGAVARGLGEVLPSGRYPHGIVHVDVSPSDVDVNVHPQKLEVRFHRPSHVAQCVCRCLETLRERFVERPRVASPGPPARVYRLDEQQSEGSRAAETAVSIPDRARRRAEAMARFWAPAQTDLNTVDVDYGLGAALSRRDRVGGDGGAGDGGKTDNRGRHELTLVGHAFEQVLVCQLGEELLLIDERAAWRLVALEQLRSQLEQGEVSTHCLKRPVRLVLDNVPRALLRSDEQDLSLAERLGMYLEPFGPNDWVLRRVPTLMAGRATDDVFLAQLAAEFVQALGRDDATDCALSLVADVAYGELRKCRPPEELLGHLEPLLCDGKVSKQRVCSAAGCQRTVALSLDRQDLLRGTVAEVDAKKLQPRKGRVA